MNNTSVIQVRLPLDWRVQGEKRAEEAGFSSLQDAIRLWIKQFVDGMLTIRVDGDKNQLDDEEKYLIKDKKYLASIRRAREDVKAGRVISMEELAKELNL
jgi:hypothetical protein